MQHNESIKAEEYKELGVVLYNLLDEYNEALIYFSRAIEKDPNVKNGYFNRGRIFYEIGKPDEAIADFTQAIALDPNNAGLYYYRAMAHSETGNHEEAIKDLTQAIKLDPKNPRAYYALAMIYDETKNSHDASVNYTTAIKLAANQNPKNKLYELIYMGMRIHLQLFVNEHEILTAEEYKNLAYSLVNDGQLKYNEALTYYNRAIKQNPKYAIAYHLRGILLSRRGKYDEAIADFTQAIALDPNRASSYFYRAITHRKTGNLEEAINDLHEVIKLDPDSKEAYHALAVLYHKAGKFDDALVNYNLAFKKDPYLGTHISLKLFLDEMKKNEEAAKILAQACFDRGMNFLNKKNLYNEAILCFTQAIELDPNNASYFYNRAIAYHTTGNIKEEIKDLTQAIKLEKLTAEEYRDRGISLFKQEKYNEAILNFTQAIELDPKNASYFYNRAIAYHSTGNTEEKIKDLTQAIKLENLTAEEYRDRGISLFKQEKYNEAILNYDLAIKLNPTVEGGYCNRGQAFFKLKNYDAAIKDFNEAINLNKKDVNAYYYRAFAYYDSGNNDSKNTNAAMEDFTQVIALDPDNKMAYYLRGYIQYTGPSNGSYKTDAINDFNEAIRLDPKYSPPYLQRAKMLSNLGQHDKAIKDYNTLIELNPTANNYYYRGLMYMGQSKFEQAFADFLQAYIRDPKHAETNAQLIKVLDELEKPTILKCIKKLSVLEQFPLLEESLDPLTIFGMRFYKQEGRKPCNINSGTLAVIDKYLFDLRIQSLTKAILYLSIVNPMPKQNLNLDILGHISLYFSQAIGFKFSLENPAITLTKFGRSRDSLFSRTYKVPSSTYKTPSSMPRRALPTPGIFDHTQSSPSLESSTKESSKNNFSLTWPFLSEFSTHEDTAAQQLTKLTNCNENFIKWFDSLPNNSMSTMPNSNNLFVYKIDSDQISLHILGVSSIINSPKDYPGVVIKRDKDQYIAYYNDAAKYEAKYLTKENPGILLKNILLQIQKNPLEIEAKFYHSKKP